MNSETEQFWHANRILFRVTHACQAVYIYIRTRRLHGATVGETPLIFPRMLSSFPGSPRLAQPCRVFSPSVNLRQWVYSGVIWVHDGPRSLVELWWKFYRRTRSNAKHDGMACTPLYLCNGDLTLLPLVRSCCQLTVSLHADNSASYRRTEAFMIYDHRCKRCQQYCVLSTQKLLLRKCATLKSGFHYPS